MTEIITECEYELLDEEEICNHFKDILRLNESYASNISFNGDRNIDEIAEIMASDYYGKNFRIKFGLAAMNGEFLKKWQNSFKKENLDLKSKIDRVKVFYLSKIDEILDEYSSEILCNIENTKIFWENKIKIIQVKDRLINAINSISTFQELKEFQSRFDKKVIDEMKKFRGQIIYNYEKSNENAELIANEIINKENAKINQERRKQMKRKNKKLNKKNKLNSLSHIITSLFIKINYNKKKQRFYLRKIKRFIQSFLIRKEFNEKNKPKFIILKSSRKIIYNFLIRSIYIIKKMIKYKIKNNASHKIISIFIRDKYNKKLLKDKYMKLQSNASHKITSIFVKNKYYNSLLKDEINASHIITSMFIKNKYNKKKIRYKIIKKKFNIGDAVSSTLSNSKIQRHWGNVIEVKGDKLKVQSAKSTSFITSDICNWTHYIDVR